MAKINGIDDAGAMSMQIQAGYDEVLSAAPDALQVALGDRSAQFVRGRITTQNYAAIIDILTGTLGTYTCYERTSGVAALTGYKKHTITNPVIHEVNFRISQGGYAVCEAAFECRAADPTKTIADMWTRADSQSAPTPAAFAPGGFRVVTALHGAQAVYHVTAFDFRLTLGLSKRCNDGDIAYTCVDAELDGLEAGGSLGFEDTSVGATLLAAARGDLVLTVRQHGSAANKVITVAGVEFNSSNYGAQSGANYSTDSLNYRVTNDADTPLTVAGANPIISIEDEA